MNLESYEYIHYTHVLEHEESLTDYKLCQYEPNLIISATSKNLNIWKYTPESIGPSSKMEPYQKKDMIRISKFHFNPAYKGVLTLIDNSKIIIYDFTKMCQITSYPNQDVIYDVSWDPNGNVLYSTCKNFKLKVFDTRTNTEDVYSIPHNRARQVGIDVFRSGALIATHGYNTQGFAETAVFDVRNLKEPLEVKKMQSTSSNAYTLIDNDILYSSYKGCRYIDAYTFDETFKDVNRMVLSQPLEHLALAPNTKLRYDKSEVSMFYQLSGNSIYPLHIYRSEEVVSMGQWDEVPCGIYEQMTSLVPSHKPTNDIAQWAKDGNPPLLIALNPGNKLAADLERLYNSMILSDVEIVCSNGEVVRAHKGILAARSPYWNRLLKVSFSDQYNETTVEANIFRKILFYMYTDHIEKASSEESNKMIVLATLYCMDECVERLRCRIDNKIKPTTSRYHHDFDSLLKYADIFFANTVIKTDRIDIPCHSYILAVRIDYMMTLFNGGFTHNNTVTLENWGYDEVMALLTYVYKDSADITPQNVLEVLRGSHMYAFRELQKQCESYLLSVINQETCLDILRAATDIGSALRYQVLNYIIANQESIKNISSLDSEILAEIESKKAIKFSGKLIR